MDVSLAGADEVRMNIRVRKVILFRMHMSNIMNEGADRAILTTPAVAPAGYRLVLDKLVRMGVSLKNLLFWGRSAGPTTSQQLAGACDRHIAHRRETLSQTQFELQEQEEVVRKEEAGHSESRRARVTAEEQLRGHVSSAQDRLRRLSTAIGIAVTEPVENASDTVYATFEMAETMVARDFREILQQLRTNVEKARETETYHCTRLEGARAQARRLQEACADIRRNIIEIQSIKVQLDSQLMYVGAVSPDMPLDVAPNMAPGVAIAIPVPNMKGTYS